VRILLPGQRRPNTPWCSPVRLAFRVFRVFRGAYAAIIAMPDRAHVSSVDALESLRSSLIVYVSKARPTLEEVSADVQRTRGWLEGEQRTYWENEFKRRHRALEEAQAAVFRSRISNLREVSAAEQMDVRRAKRDLDEAEAKLRVVKQWGRVFDSRVGPLVKQMEKLHTVLTNDMVLAIAYLKQAIDTLHNYAEIIPPPTTGAAPAEGSTPKHSQSQIANGQAGAAPVDSSEPKLEGQP
jgi:hypothetical protein